MTPGPTAPPRKLGLHHAMVAVGATMALLLLCALVILVAYFLTRKE